MGGFERLDHRVQRWIRAKGWRQLRDVQERAIPLVLDGSSHILVMASTAAGKTEAAFLPVLTSVVEGQNKRLSVIYIAPLKALINDQYSRLDELCKDLDINVVRWHGDAPQTPKDAMAKKPGGVVLITPESIEALFVRRPAVARRMFSSVDYIVIDELHYFLEGPRGLHLSSLLNRLEEVGEKKARRIGLSATVGDVDMALDFLSSGRPHDCIALKANDSRPELKTQIKAYIEDEEVDDQDALEGEGAGNMALDRIADDIFRLFRGSSNLVFAGSRRRVESLTDRLRDRSESRGFPNEFFAHHGSLSKEMREDLEVRLKTGSLPTTAVATTTLELGIDIGQVKATAQIGAPMSMAGLRQRLGRTGRREGVAAILRLFVREYRVHGGSSPLERLRLDTVRAVAAIRLLIADYVEPPQPDLLVPTVVLHQILSLIAERGGLLASDLYRLICSKGRLSDMPKKDFAELLRGMAHPNVRLIEQARSGLIMLGELGERKVSRHEFFALFDTMEEWKVVTDGKALGTLPIANMLGQGSYIAFAGKRWRVEAVDNAGRIITVAPHRSAKVPMFETVGHEYLDRRLVEEMRLVLEGVEEYQFLDATAKEFLEEARQFYRSAGADKKHMIVHRNVVHVFTWRGTTVNQMLALAFNASGLPSTVHDAGISVPGSNGDEVASTIDALVKAGVDIDDVVAGVETFATGKWDEYVPLEVLKNQWKRTYSRALPELNELLKSLALSPLDFGVDVSE